MVVKKKIATLFYDLGKAFFHMLGKIFGVSRSVVAYRWIKQEAAKLPQPLVDNQIQEIEFDEMWHFVGSKKWIFKTLNRGTRRTVAWVIGNHDARTCQRLYKKIKHLTKLYII